MVDEGAGCEPQLAGRLPAGPVDGGQSVLALDGAGS